jgi:hypothetical protein
VVKQADGVAGEFGHRLHIDRADLDEMMGEAAKDARARAEQIAAQGGRIIKELRNARMGVVQINPRYSSATSWEGNNDTSSLEKTLITTVTATFSMQ